MESVRLVKYFPWGISWKDAGNRDRLQAAALDRLESRRRVTVSQTVRYEINSDISVIASFIAGNLFEHHGECLPDYLIVVGPDELVGDLVQRVDVPVIRIHTDEEGRVKSIVQIDEHGTETELTRI